MAQLPLVVAVDCLAEHAALLRRTLSGVAAVEGTGAGWGAAAAPQDRISGAALVLARSLHELSPGVLALLRGVPAVVLLCPWEGSTEEALGAELGIRRVVRAGPPADEERADTALALLLALARRTHALAREVARGAWLPAPSAYRGARRCAGLHLALVGLDGCTAGVARRAAAFGMRVSFVHPAPQNSSVDQLAQLGTADAEFVSAAESAGAARASSLQALLQSAEAVLLHASGSACVLGEAQLALLPRGALVVSISAPGAMDAAALKRALCTGALGGAAIDAPDSDAWLEAWARDAPNLVITPRVARCSDEALALAAAAAAAAALELLQPAK